MQGSERWKDDEVRELVNFVRLSGYREKWPSVCVVHSFPTVAADFNHQLQTTQTSKYMNFLFPMKNFPCLYCSCWI